MSAKPSGGGLLLLHSSDESYGSDRMVHALVRSMPESVRADMRVWLPDSDRHPRYPLCRRIEDLGVEVAHVRLPVLRRQQMSPSGLARLSGAVRRLRGDIRDLGPDQLILGTSALLPAVGACPHGTRLVLYQQEIWTGPQRRILGTLARRANLIIANSGATRDSLPAPLHDRVVLVPNCTEDPGPDAAPPAGSDEHLTFLMGGRWAPRKGHEQLLTAWDDAGCPGRLIVAGGPPPLGSAVDVACLVADSARPETVVLAGELPHLAGLLPQVDVVVVPSLEPESFGLTAVEAFAWSRPVIAAATGGLSEVVVAGTGWLHTPGDTQELSRLLSERRPDEVRAAGVQARQRYLTLYTPDTYRLGIRQALGFTQG